MKQLKIKRVYDKTEKADGFRVLVDRLWPRGLKKEDAHLDLWLKEIAPSTELRQWFGHDEKKWSEFQKRYLAELKGKKELVQSLWSEADSKVITLLFSAKDVEHNNAVVLKRFLEKLN